MMVDIYKEMYKISTLNITNKPHTVFFKGHKYLTKTLENRNDKALLKKHWKVCGLDRYKTTFNGRSFEIRFS